MLRTLIKKIITRLKGRSASQTARSELDKFIDDFERNRQSEPQTRQIEREKANSIAQKRDFNIDIST